MIPYNSFKIVYFLIVKELYHNMKINFDDSNTYFCELSLHHNETCIHMFGLQEEVLPNLSDVIAQFLLLLSDIQLVHTQRPIPLNDICDAHLYREREVADGRDGLQDELEIFKGLWWLLQICGQLLKNSKVAKNILNYFHIQNCNNMEKK